VLLRVPRVGNIIFAFLGALIIAAACELPANAGQQSSSSAILQPYVGNLYLMRGLGRTPDLHLNAGSTPATGQCDAAVSVSSASFTGAAVQLRVEPIGSPQIEQRTTMSCVLPRQINISISGFAPHATGSAITAAVNKFLLSPEAYLTSYGIVLNQSAIPGDPESPVGQSSMIDFAPPRPLLSVYADYSEPVKQSSGGSVVVQALIGRDGRVYSATVLNGLSDAINDQVLKLYRLWRLKPAHVGDQLVAYQLNLETRFR
jgi:hypothetical protein